MARGAVLRGIWPRIISSYLGSIAAVMSEAMKPGATALHVMPLGANSRATVFVKPMTPACGIFTLLSALLQSLCSPCVTLCEHQVPFLQSLVQETQKRSEFLWMCNTPQASPE